VELCVQKAQAAQKKWRETSFAERRAFLHDLMDAIVVNQDEIARASSCDTGKTSMD
jgi:acyl-CoA reductase-like NAD-dependent aldehyde dehydrogenase